MIDRSFFLLCQTLALVVGCVNRVHLDLPLAIHSINTLAPFELSLPFQRKVFLSKILSRLVNLKIKEIKDFDKFQRKIDYMESTSLDQE